MKNNSEISALVLFITFFIIDIYYFCEIILGKLSIFKYIRLLFIQYLVICLAEIKKSS